MGNTSRPWLQRGELVTCTMYVRWLYPTVTLPQFSRLETQVSCSSCVYKFQVYWSRFFLHIYLASVLCTCCVEYYKTLSTVRALLLLGAGSLPDCLQRQVVGVVPPVPPGTVGEVISKSREQKGQGLLRCEITDSILAPHWR